MASRYVDNAATGSNNGTSWTNAWTSFSSITGLAAGDTLYISGGTTSKTYSTVFDMVAAGINGSSGNRITVTRGTDTGHNGEPILSGGANHKFSTGHFNFTNITVYARFELNDCEDWTVTGCTFKATNDQMVYLRYTGNTGTTEVFSNNIVIDSGAVTYQTDGIYIALVRSGSTLKIQNNTITLTNTDATPHCDCIQGYTLNGGDQGTIVISGNKLRHAGTDGQGIIISYEGTTSGVIQIYNNTIELAIANQHSPILVQNLSSAGCVYKIWNNTIYHAYAFGCINLTSPTADTEVKNNIVIYMHASNAGEGIHRLVAGSWPVAGNIDYNCYYSPTVTPNWAYVDTGTVTYSTRATFNTATGHDAHSLYQDPKLVSPPTDMSLQAISPCIGAGTTIGTFSTDILGITRS